MSFTRIFSTLEEAENFNLLCGGTITIIYNWDELKSTIIKSYKVLFYVK